MISESDKSYLIRLAKRIKTLRNEKGFKQYDFDVTVRTIQRIENLKDSFNPTYLTLLKISETLGISVSELLDFPEETKEIK